MEQQGQPTQKDPGCSSKSNRSPVPARCASRLVVQLSRYTCRRYSQYSGLRPDPRGRAPLPIANQILTGQQSYRVSTVTWRSTHALKALATDAFGATVRVSYFFKSTLTTNRLSGILGLVGERQKLPVRYFPEVLDSGIHNGDLFVVEKVPPGCSLAELSTRRDLRGNDLEIAEFATFLSKAVGILHDHGLVHGQLDPQNIWLEGGDIKRPILLDVGAFLLLPEEHPESLPRLYYLAPERFGHGDTSSGRASDLYSIGVVLYHLAGGAMPFSGDDLKSVAHSVYSAVFTPVSASQSEFSPNVSAIIARLVRKSPKDRYHSASGLDADLATALAMLQGQKAPRPFALGRADQRRELNYAIPIVGRLHEKKVLTDGLARTATGRGVLHVIAARSGMGKTKLARDVLAIGSAQGFEIYATKFSTYESNIPLSAVGRILQQHADQVRALPTAERRVWQERVLAALGGRGQLLSRIATPYQGLLPEFPTHPELPREEEERVFFATFAEFLTLMTLNGVGTQVFIDDLQWADSVSLQVLRHLAIRAKDASLSQVQMIGAYRSEEVSPSHPLATTVLPHFAPNQIISLGLLSAAESAEVVELLLDERSPLVDEIKEFVCTVTDGVPFNVYQVLEMIVQQTTFHQGSGTESHFDAKPFAYLQSAQGLGALTHSRLSQLSKAARVVAATAAVAGATVDLVSLRRLFARAAMRSEGGGPSGIDGDLDTALQAAIEELEHEHFVRRTTETFSFVHDRIQKGAWTLVNADEHRELHHDYSVILGELAATKPGEPEPQMLFEIAHHVLRGDPERRADFALTILSKAGAAAISLFAYRRAKEYLGVAVTLLTEPPGPAAAGVDKDVWRAKHRSTWLRVYELFADALALAEHIEQAISVYQRLLPWCDTRYHRAELYGKLTLNFLFLLRYVDSVAAGVKGYQELNKKYTLSNAKALVLIVFGMPWLLLNMVWFHVFGQQTRDELSSEEEAAWRILMAIQVPVFWTQPLCAVANFILPTCRLLYFKDCALRATMFTYWGIATGAFGAKKLSRKLFRHADAYYDHHLDPVGQLFAIFTRGVMVEFSSGNSELCLDLIDRSRAMSADIGESFWRAMGYQFTVHIDQFGHAAGHGIKAAQDLAAFQQRIGFAASSLASSLPIFLELGRTDDLRYWQASALKVVDDIKAAKLNTMDAIYTMTGVGEILMMQGKIKEAIGHLRGAFGMSVRGIHRLAYCLYAPILLAQAYVRNGQRLRAIPPLAFAWFNIGASVRTFVPQTLFASGEFLVACGLRRLGLGFMQRGIEHGQVKGWLKATADLRLQYGEYLLARTPEQAALEFGKAHEFFVRYEYLYSATKAAQALARAEAAFAAKYPKSRPGSIKVEASVGQGLRQQIEVQTMIDLFLQLSVVTDLSKLVGTAVDCLMTATGADHGVIYLKDKDSWKLWTARGIAADQRDAEPHVEDQLDMSFLRSVMAAPGAPAIRPAEGAGLSSGAVMVVPLVFEGECCGLVYLGHRAIGELFAPERLEVVAALARQIAISLDNFYLIEEVKNLNASLEQHLAHVESEVSNRTRDIKSIFRAIELGIMVILPTRRIHDEYSKHLEVIFGTHAIAGLDAVELLFANSNISPEIRDITKHALDSVLGEADFTFSLNSPHFPREIQRRRAAGTLQILELQWSPEVDDGGTITKVLVVVRDATSHRQLVSEANQRRLDLVMIGELLTSEPSALLRFFAFAAMQLKQMVELATAATVASQSEGLERLFILVHTLKGLSRMHRLSSLTDVVHEAEDLLVRVRDHGAAWQPAQLLQRIEPIATSLQAYEAINHITLKRAQTTSQAGSPSAISAVAVWFAAVPAIAQEADKPEPQLSIRVAHLNITEEMSDLMAAVLSHLIHNALDHGIEMPADRTLKGKHPVGTIFFSIVEQNANLVMRFSDDGVGLNLTLMRQRAVERQLLTASSDLSAEATAELMFLPGYTTKSAVTQLSGRGVGMGAVRALIEDHGGRVSIELADPAGETVSFVTVISLPMSLRKKPSIHLSLVR